MSPTSYHVERKKCSVSREFNVVEGSALITIWMSSLGGACDSLRSSMEHCSSIATSTHWLCLSSWKAMHTWQMRSVPKSPKVSQFGSYSLTKKWQIVSLISCNFLIAHHAYNQNSISPRWPCSTASKNSLVRVWCNHRISKLMHETLLTMLIAAEDCGATHGRGEAPWWNHLRVQHLQSATRLTLLHRATLIFIVQLNELVDPPPIVLCNRRHFNHAALSVAQWQSPSLNVWLFLSMHYLYLCVTVLFSTSLSPALNSVASLQIAVCCNVSMLMREYVTDMVWSTYIGHLSEWSSLGCNLLWVLSSPFALPSFHYDWCFMLCFLLQTNAAFHFGSFRTG